MDKLTRKILEKLEKNPISIPVSNLMKEIREVSYPFLESLARNKLIHSNKIFNWQPHTLIKIDIEGKKLLSQIRSHEQSERQIQSIKGLKDSTENVNKSIKESHEENKEIAKENRNLTIVVIGISSISLIIGVFAIALSVNDSPEFPLPFEGPRIIPADKECFVTGDYMNVKEMCSSTHIMRLGYGFGGEVDIVPDNIEQVLSVEPEFYDVDCKMFNMPDPRFSCDVSSEISREYSIKTLYITNRTVAAPNQVSLSPHGDFDCFESECVTEMIVTSPLDMGLRGYKIFGPGRNYAEGKRVVKIEENNLLHHVTTSDESGNYFWKVSIPKDESKLYTVHILSPLDNPASR